MAINVILNKEYNAPFNAQEQKSYDRWNASDTTCSNQQYYARTSNHFRNTLPTAAKAARTTQ